MRASEIEILTNRTRIDVDEARIIVDVANNLRNNAQDPIDVSLRNTLELARMRKKRYP